MAGALVLLYLLSKRAVDRRFVHLMREAKFGFVDTERAAFLIRDESATRCLGWPWKHEFKRRSRKRGIDSIAVIPRISPASDPEFAYLLEGIAEAVTEHLARTPALRVLARSTAFRSQAGTLGLDALRRDLRVSAIATIGLTVDAPKLAVSVELISTERRETLMTRQYNGSIDAPHKLADDAARDLLSVARPARKRRTTTRKTDPQAYHLFLKARFQWNKRSPDGIKQAIDFYQRAIEIDPAFASAYVGLADAYNLLGFLGVMPPRLVYPKAKAAAKRAIELDTTSGEAYTSLGYATGQYDWNFAGAVRLHDEAIKRSPRDANAHHWRGLTGCMPAGQFDEALASVREAEALDPLTPIMSVGVGSVLYFARRYEDARQLLEHIREIEPKFMAVYRWLGLAYEQPGRYEEALAAMKALHELAPSSVSAAFIARCYAVSGQRDAAIKLAGETMKHAGRGYVSTLVPLMTAMGLGDRERAIESLNTAIEDRASWLFLANVDPRFDRMREWMGTELQQLIADHAIQTWSLRPLHDGRNHPRTLTHYPVQSELGRRDGCCLLRDATLLQKMTRQ